MIKEYRSIILKKQLKTYFKKKKRKQQQEQQINEYHLKNISNVIIHHQSQQIESSSIQHSTMVDFQLTPDLSKRKYIYKDITLSNDNQNHMNWRVFQCTQQSSSSMSYFDQSVTNDRNYNPFYFTNNPISLPDIRIGLSRHHSIKQLHKTVIN
ncbi:unnamed protein product [Rotaria sordida]|uniref:Uncharacterized protein n=1 Tax=Rotaria sordida TaxID=392033 RepID=A0A813SGP6_9BILA|nr:unnamed protein product [Rotaria sordida]